MFGNERMDAFIESYKSCMLYGQSQRGFQSPKFQNTIGQYIAVGIYINWLQSYGNPPVFKLT
jgi:hypothetical protein